MLEAQQRLRSSRRLGALARVSALRRSSAKGREVRHYSLLSENAYRAELNAIRALTDARTKLVLVNSRTTRPVQRSATPRCSHCMTSSPAAASSSSWMRLSPDLLWTDCGLRSAASSCHGGERFFEGALPGRTAHGLVGGARKRMSSCREARSYFTVSNTSMGEALAAVAVRQREKILARAR